ncbi:hypothetical protein [Sulfitobacter sp. MOLA879]|uniref:hypothetical protein n=1 Tax=Sulfitobacter sp. MOLA879 TaxID=3368579 RepID=UPI003744E125
MVKPTIDALTATVPQLGQAPAEFDANTNEFLPQLVPLQDQINLMVDWVQDTATAVDDNAAAALISEAEAENAAFDAGLSADEAADSAALAFSGGAAAAGADVHVPNAAYTASNPASAVVSNVNGQTYRCIVSHSGVATDPANDAARWVRITFNGAYTDLSGKPSLGTAATKNTGTTSGTVPLIGAGDKLPASVVPPGMRVVYQEFTASGTFTKEADDIMYLIEVIGGGSGSYYGHSRVYGSGGCCIDGWLMASDVPATVSVLVGAGGTGSVEAGQSEFLQLKSGRMKAGRPIPYFDGTEEGIGAPGVNFAIAGTPNTIKGGGAPDGTSVGVSLFHGNSGGNMEDGQVPGGAGGYPSSSGTQQTSGARGAVRIWRFKA